MVTGQIIEVDITSGTGVDGTYTIATHATDSFTYTAGTSLTTSGNITIKSFIRASNNVTSITHNSTGDYTITFTTAMSDTFYAVHITTDNAAAAYLNGGAVTSLSTGSCRITTHDYNSLKDHSIIMVTIFR